MDSNGFPFDVSTPGLSPTGASPSDPSASGVSAAEARRRRQLAIAVVGGALAALLGFGAVATTLAADPSPSPSAGTQVTPGPRSNQGGGTHRGGMKGNCPNMGSGGNGSGGSGGGATPQNPESPNPSESPSDVPQSL